MRLLVVDFKMFEVSSDEEYFPTQEGLEDEDEMIEEEEFSEEDEEEDEDEESGEEYDLYNVFRHDPNQDMIEDEVEEENESEDDQVERILLQNNPGLLRRIQQVLQHGMRSGGGRGGLFEDEPPQRRRRRQLDLPPVPYAAGKRLLNSGEFGPVDDPNPKRRRYESPRTVTQFSRFRELGYKRENPIYFTRKWIPPKDQGRMVAQYDRHVYSGQFSHDGSFFYTAAQDFKCRMYSTPNPANPRDWKLYKVPPLMVELT